MIDFYFEGNAPEFVIDVGRASLTAAGSRIFYLPDAVGWGTVWPGPFHHRTALWLPRTGEMNFNSEDGSVSIDVHWAQGRAVELEYTTNLATPDPEWHSLGSATIGPDRMVTLEDSDNSGGPVRIYRLRTP